jgi:hypothetical protein
MVNGERKHGAAMSNSSFAKILHELRNHLDEITGSELKVWLCHKLHEGRASVSFPSLKLIAKETGLHFNTASAAHTSLRQKGWLKTLTYKDSAKGTFAVPVITCVYPWLENTEAHRTRKPVSGGTTIPVSGHTRKPVSGGTTIPVNGFSCTEGDTCKEETGEEDAREGDTGKRVKGVSKLVSKLASLAPPSGANVLSPFEIPYEQDKEAGTTPTPTPETVEAVGEISEEWLQEYLARPTPEGQISKQQLWEEIELSLEAAFGMPYFQHEHLPGPAVHCRLGLAGYRL